MRKDERIVGVIAAMQIEAEDLVSAMTEVREERIGGMLFRAGRLNGIGCVIAVCGIGKVFAAICAQTMILRYAPALILNTGVAGTLTDRLSIGDVIVGERLVQHDMDTSALGDPVGMISGINRVYLPCSEEYSALLLRAAREEGLSPLSGTIASGDRFMSDSAEKQRIVGRFGAMACEMEGAAIGQTCFVNDVPCCVMRAISDGGDEAAAIDYPTFAKTAAKRGASVVRRFFSLL